MPQREGHGTRGKHHCCTERVKVEPGASKGARGGHGTVGLVLH